MNKSKTKFTIEIEGTENRCPIGEEIGERNIREAKIPVLSCEGACIRGEIARLAANLVARNKTFARGCHGEFLSVPESAMAQWVKNAKKVVLIDGCFLRCHGRIIENLIGQDKLVQFDALSFYKKYTDVFDIDEIPEAERKDLARQVAEKILASLKDSTLCDLESQPSCV